MNTSEPLHGQSYRVHSHWRWGIGPTCVLDGSKRKGRVALPVKNGFAAASATDADKPVFVTAILTSSW